MRKVLEVVRLAWPLPPAIYICSRSALAGLALACYAAIWVSARIYRVGLLMYGKKPSMRELVKWIRMA